jgi:hypothetical protein
MFALGCVPFIGTAASAVIGAFIGGWFLAVELSGFAFHRRGLRYGQFRKLLSRRRGLMWGFGVPVFLLALIPLGAIVTMPAAVAGATLLARDVLGEPFEHPAAAPPQRLDFKTCDSRRCGATCGPWAASTPRAVTGASCTPPPSGSAATGSPRRRAAAT